MRFGINHVAVWLLVFAQQAVGFIWYSSALFGEMWLALQDKTAAGIDSSNPLPFAIALLAAVATTYFVAWLLLRLHVTTVSAALRVALALWACVSLGELAMHYAFLGLRPGLLAIDAGKSLVNFLLSAAVLTVWQAKARRVARRRPVAPGERADR